MNMNYEFMLMLRYLDEHNEINSHSLIFCMRRIPCLLNWILFFFITTRLSISSQLSAEFFCLLKILAFSLIMFSIIDISFSWRLFAFSSVCCTCLFEKHWGMHYLHGCRPINIYLDSGIWTALLSFFYITLFFPLGRIINSTSCWTSSDWWNYANDHYIWSTL